MKMCNKAAVAKVTFAGNPTKYACEKHLKHVQAVSKKLNISPEIELLESIQDEYKCEQEI